MSKTIKENGSSTSIGCGSAPRPRRDGMWGCQHMGKGNQDDSFVVDLLN